ncbi:hypothetical protein APA_2798 [Pseudanabaena sp. lw0831]|uniref:DUF305 domain-containing protein n=1 Tax=Pseudanabaena sp. lw0831 TaxID=1357935 RepID=UPI001915B400|nr:DUF305 domain-containing protein [Pseudanabaena sp. lw0831]GBO54747.1 hypothetical protein APA_2798 [Pseudanabaena sp. lw0831]
MKNKFLIYSLAGLLSSVAVTRLADSIQAQSSTASESSQQSRSIQVDQHFIEMMIPHHQDAIAMADLALILSQRPEVKKIAEAIKKDQTREIQEMRTWYKQWYGKEVPLTSMTDMKMMGNPPKQGSGSPMMNMDKNMMSMMHNMMSEGSPMMNMGKDSMSMGYNMIAMGHRMMSMGQNMMNMGHSMMSMDMDALKTASDFDKEFVRQMVPHHQMAVMMAQMASTRSTRPEIRTLAQSIIKSQNTEIMQMKGWQQAWNQ